ncbi:MAG: hypothetical protein HYV29_12410 [Ignavibacteriales bacterium]|nr:hypothetical protein [Ignavibacteriales bacterium]
MHHEFKYKLDFYYQQSLIYLLTLIVYIGVKGTFIEDSVTLVFHDPIIYIIAFFVLLSFVTLFVNRIRDRKLIVTDTKITFHHRFNERSIEISEIEWIHIGKERMVQTAGRSQVIIIKTKHRRRAFRIRLGRYERERELLRLLEHISEKSPKRQRRFQFNRKK